MLTLLGPGNTLSKSLVVATDVHDTGGTGCGTFAVEGNIGGTGDGGTVIDVEDVNTGAGTGVGVIFVAATAGVVAATVATTVVVVAFTVVGFNDVVVVVVVVIEVASVVVVAATVVAGFVGTKAGSCSSFCGNGFSKTFFGGCAVYLFINEK